DLFVCCLAETPITLGNTLVLDVTVALAVRTCSGYRIYSFNLRGGDSPLLILCHKTVIYLCNINLEEKK
ncbi:hypothetical protein, partial [Yersinia intermedia]|uniref:hypothetical protein n=1 Tax=Yersinia intermedia TaxID=631 RepID=UPI00195544A7